MYKIKKVIRSVANPYRDFELLYYYGFGRPNGQGVGPCSFDAQQVEAIINALEEAEFVGFGSSRVVRFSSSLIERNTGILDTLYLHDERTGLTWDITFAYKNNQIDVEIRGEEVFRFYSAEIVLRHSGPLPLDTEYTVSAEFVASLQDSIWKVY
jgi:hypothetical protein